MNMEWKDIIPAVFGLVGVIVGSFLTIAKESWFEKKKKQKESEYLSIQIVSMLDRFIGGCAEVVHDDGLYHGQPDKDGCSSIQVKDPEFKPESINVEWKSLPANLMYEVLSLPGDIAECKGKINSTFEYVADPPDYEEGFEERQYQYAVLGLKSIALSFKLRKFSGIPSKDYGEWNPEKNFRDKQHQINETRKRRSEAQAKMLNDMACNSA